MIAFALFAIGLALSAFFSGSETGLYRVSRTRLVLDGLDGVTGARGLLWLLNHPAIFIATTLVGNNAANYLTSFAIVLGVAGVFGNNATAELMGPILMTPLVFVFGELLPKHFFYQAPYRLLRRVRPALLLATVVFLPVSLVLGLLGNVLRFLTGQTPFRTSMAMARGELDQLMRAGQEAGILGARQRSLAQGVFEIGNQPAISFGVPTDRLAVVAEPIDLDAARQKARRKNHPMVLVGDPDRITGFFWYADLCVRDPKVKPLPVIRGLTTDRHLQLLLRLYDSRSDVAVLYDERGKVRSVVTKRQLLQTLVSK
ncbi:MAG: CNNM domain-containing protein [Planctomycetota bacterium]